MAKVAKKESKWRIAGAVLAGYGTLGLLAVLTEWIIGFVAPQIHAARELPSSYYMIVGVTDAMWAFTGGYVCAKIALTAHRPAAIGLIILGELIALAAAVQSWYTAPHAFSILLLLFYPGLVWVGASLRVRLVPVKPIMVRA